MSTHQIIVGNVGTVCTTTDRALALKEFSDWAEVSLGYTGRGAGEPVSWMINGEPHKEVAGRELPHLIGTLPDHELTAEQLDEKYNETGDGEHPRFLRIDWQIAVGAEETISGYWAWLRHQLITEHENAPENQVNVHNFTVKVTAPVALSREEVLELLNLFSDAATQQLHDTQDDDGADEDERERAAKALTMNVEVL